MDPARHASWNPLSSELTLESLVLCVALNIDVLPCNEMRCRDARPHRYHGVFGHRELDDLMLEGRPLLQEESRLGG